LKEIQHRPFQYLFLSVFLFFTFIISGYAQGDSIVNDYAHIIKVYNSDPTDPDSVKVNDAQWFEEGDTVLFIVTKGATVYGPWNYPDPAGWGKHADYRNMGRYNILLVYKKVAGNIIIFSTKLRDLYPGMTGEIAQLIKVRGGRDVYRVDETLTCKAWNPADSTGGVFALIAGRKIVLNESIDVSGKGFLGGDPGTPEVDAFKGGCSEAAGSFYLESDFDSAGRKGESVVYEGFPYTRGMRFVLHGGGGGNGKYSGGGGGGNWGQGGSGGKESESCSPITNLGGSGSEISFFYQNNNPEYGNRIFMGGGGGTGTQNPDSGRYATKGGNGGGIIILITDTIEAAGTQFVRARGGSVTNNASAGAGGGGGGGVIIAEATKYIGDITFDVKGGDGGKTNHPDPTGPGGSGGGGVIWHSGSSLTGVSVNITNGSVGSHVPAGLRNATAGANGNVIHDLKIPLSGFLFNVMPEDQDVCQGVLPSKFVASNPKGGDGPGTYTYRWIQGRDTIILSRDTIIWNHAPGPDSAKKDYQSGPLFDTMYFKRIVYSGATTDTSLLLTINVLPRLENNNIAADDTICIGSVIPEIKDYPVYNIKGGNETYRFSWLSGIDTVNWNTIPGKDSLILLAETPLQTTFYRRIVNSHVCWDTSNRVTVTVLLKISDNKIFSGSLNYPDDTICQNDNPMPITGLLPGNGDGVYKYIWQSSPDSLSWNTTVPSNGRNYDPGVLSDTIYYRRIVISGSHDVCRHTSKKVTILVHPLLTNNKIAPDTVICMDYKNLRLRQLSGKVGGGDEIQNKYYWQSKVQPGSWQETGNEVTLPNYSPGYIEDTTLYRRLIISGACENFSDSIVVIVQDSIMNNLIADNDTICRDAVPVPITGTLPTGGDIRYSLPSYQWESRSNGTSWATVAGANQMSYSPPSLSDTTHYRRKVTSGKCIHFSDPVVVIVQAPITNNAIHNGSVDSTCYETTLDLDGTAGIFEMTGGDRVNYAYGWQKSIDDQDWSPAPGFNSLADYTTEELMLPAYFRRFAVSGACSDTTLSTFVYINPRPTAKILETVYLTECYDNKVGPVEVNVPYILTGTPPFRIISYDGFEYDTVEYIQSYEGFFTDYLVTPGNNDFNIKIDDLTDGNGCVAYTDSLTGEVIRTVYKRPEIHIIRDGDTVQVCDDIIQLESTQDVGAGYWMKASGDNYLSIDDSAELIVQVSTQHGSGNRKHYKLYRKGKNWSIPEEDRCISLDSVEVVFWKEPEPAYAGSKTGVEFDTVIYFADYMFMYANPPSAGSGMWSVTSGTADIVNDTLCNTRINLGDQDLDEPTDYAFRWTVNNGICPETSDEIKIARRDIRIYEGFSPDGNSINEFFTIEGLVYADTWDLKIFSRSGNLIRHISRETGETELEEDQLWDGTYDGGRPVESGIYYYILEVTKGDHSPYQYKGFVVIARERI
jgi:gliding motility-associated-like protein